MSSIKLESNASGTGIFTIASPNSNTNRTLTLPDNTGTILTSASTVSYPKGGPAFRGYRSGTQAYTTNTFTKVQINETTFDTASCFDKTTNYRFTPNVAGYYLIMGQAMSSAGTYFETDIYKNGVSAGFTQILGAYGIPISQIIYLNGSTDYVELYVFITTSGNITAAGTYFQGFLASAA